MSYLATGQAGIRIVFDPAASAPKCVPTLNQNIQISKVVNGFPLVINSDVVRAGEIVSMTYRGTNYIIEPSHGDGWGWAHNATPTIFETTTANIYSPTQSGNESDGVNLRITSSNLLYLGISPAGDEVVSMTKAAFWWKPGQSQVPIPNINTRILSEMVTTYRLKIGAFGSDNLIAYKTTIIIPRDALLQSMTYLQPCPLYEYSPTPPFDTMTYVNPATLATRSCPGYPDKSASEVVVCSAADGSVAIGTYIPSSQMGSGYYEGYNINAGFTSSITLPKFLFPGGIPPMVQEFEGYVPWGYGAAGDGMAQVLAAIQLARTNRP